MLFTRLYQIRETKAWHTTTYGTQFSTPTSLRRVRLTEEELFVLRPFRRLLAA
jgi:hypothetical protein